MRKKGFTLIEIVITMALMAILVGVYFIVANPVGQLKSSRNAERKLQLQTIMNAVRQNIADSPNDQFQCTVSGTLPTSSKRMTSTAGAGNYNIGPCIIGPANPYLYVLPFDPSASSSHYTSVADYDTGYTISISTSGVVTLTAPYTETSTVMTTTVSISG